MKGCANSHESATGSLRRRMRQKKSVKMEVLQCQKESKVTLQRNPQLEKRMTIRIQQVRGKISAPNAAKNYVALASQGT